MAVQFGAEDLLLLGYKNAHVEPIPVRGGCYLAKAELVLGASRIEHDYIYVPSAATIDDLQEVYSHTFKSGFAPTIVTSESGLTPATLKRIFPRSEIQNLNSMLWKKVHEGFSSYIDSLKNNVVLPEVYVPPRGELDSPKDQVDLFVLDAIRQDRGSFILLKASAGVGKTTVARQLAREVARQSGTAIYQRRVIPVLIESAHWGRQINSLESLFQVIENSVRNFARDDGGVLVSQRLFERALARGFFLIVFDGFDEFFSASGNLDANQTITDLLEFSTDGEAKIVVTARSQFWDSVVDQSRAATITTVEMLPFNKQQATKYIDECFKEDRTLYQRARDAYSHLAADGLPRNSGGPRAQFANLPVCVSMLCDAIKSGVEVGITEGGRPMDFLLHAICEREKKRQSLDNTAVEQLKSFKELALQGEEFDDLTLEVVGLTSGRKLESHPLLSKRGAHFIFKYDFLGPYFQSEALHGAVFERIAPNGDAIAQLAKLADGKSAVFEHMAGFFEEIPGMDFFTESCQRFLQRSELQSSRTARGFLAHLGQFFAKGHRDCKGSLDRFRYAFGGMLEQGALAKVDFMGVYDSFDFSNLVFVDCSFRNVVFRHCRFTDAKFVECSFDSGIEFEPSDQGVRTSQLERCIVRGEAGLSLLSGAGELDALDELAKDLLDAGLSKFWYNGRFKASIRYSDWAKGVLGRSQFRGVLLNCLQRNGLVNEIEISGISDGGLAYDRSALRELQGFMDHRLLTGRLHRVFDDLMENLK